MTNKVCSIAQLSYGAVIERVDNAMLEILANIQDPNTAPTAQRKLTLEVSFKPNHDRTSTDVSIKTSTKLAAPAPHETRLYTGIGSSGDLYAQENNPAQQQMFEQNANVAPLRQEGVN